MLQANGAKNANASVGPDPKFPYYVNADGSVDLTATLAREQLAGVITAVNDGQAAMANAEIRRLEAGSIDQRILDVGRELVNTMDSHPGPAPDIAQGNRLALSQAATKEVAVGYGSPSSNRLPGAEPLLLSGSRLFAQGLFAHAPARHAWALGGKWNRLTGQAGVAEGHSGSVIFSIVADGRELWQSKLLKEGETASYDIGLKDAEQLELKVSDGGDGNGSDWALWLEPTLLR
jgi:hypothetical protein